MADEETRGSVTDGTLIGGRFRVERLIGRGGMGEVYAARHVTTGKEVALKRIHATAGSGAEGVRRFMREARAATAIQHPNVIEVFDVFEDSDGTPVMVMELLKGEPFSTYRERSGALRLHEIAEVLLPAARALKAAHEKGIVHRDLKPDNVFLAETGVGRTTKVLDFGIAKVLDPTKIGSETQGQSTSTGSILGTPHYMSYEQAMSDKQVDHRADIWAMGVMIFEAITGRRPLMFETLGQMYTSFLQGTVPKVREFLPDMPEDAADVLDRCLAKNANDRLGDLAPLIAVLAKYADASAPGAHVGGRVVSVAVNAPREAPVTGSPLSSSVQRPEPARRSRLALVSVLVAIVGGGIGLGAFSLTRRSPPPGPDERVLAPPPPTVSSPDPAASSAPAADIAPPLASVAPSATSAATAAGHPRKAHPVAAASVGFVPQSPPEPPNSETPKRVISDKLPY